jgi:hypothetical protein
VPRIAEPFELTEEDFLSRRPGPFDSLALEIDPPNWALGAICKIGGRRQIKRHRVNTTYNVQDSDDNYDVMPWHPMGVGGPALPPVLRPLGQVLNPETTRENPDATAAFNKALGRRRAKQASKGRKGVEAQIRASKAVAPGNLIEDDYRFWKGYALSYFEKNRGTCRWCGEECLNRKAMLDHHEGPNYCKQHLLALYRFSFKSSRQRYCMACKKETSGRRWGMPLCDEVTCISRWKFNGPKALTGFNHYRIWAYEAQYKNPKTGPFVELPQPTPYEFRPDESDDDYRGGPSC